MRAAIYVRVSTAGKTKQGDALTFVQNPEVQEQPLRDLIDQRGWTLHKVYSGRASGSAERRPGLDALMADAKRGLFQILVVCRFDRFARSVKQLVLALEEFRSLRIRAKGFWLLVRWDFWVAQYYITHGRRRSCRLTYAERISQSVKVTP